jgi:hypothetical protein
VKIVQLPQGGGKTTEMLTWLLEGHLKGIDRALIVTTQQERVRLSKKLQMLYQDNGRPTYINNAANRIYNVAAVQRNPRLVAKCEVGVDNADELLRFFLGIDRAPSIASVTDPQEDYQESENNLQF